MDTIGLRDAFRIDVDDTVAPYLWSDVDIASYADDAQKMFCRMTNGLSDSTSTICSIPIVAGQATAAVSDRILKYRIVMRQSDARPITVLNIEDLPTHGLRLDGLTGRVDAMIIGMDEHTVRWYKVPDANDVAQLVVWRLPLTDITATTTNTDPTASDENPLLVDEKALELDTQHHRALLLWMEHLAYLKQDADTINLKLSAQREASFAAYCAKAKAEQDRARHKTRVVQYGGIGTSGVSNHRSDGYNCGYRY